MLPIVAWENTMNAPIIHYTVPMKSTGTAYLWWLFLGALGAHKFYLGRPGMGVLYLCTFGLFWLGLIWDLFTLPSQVRAANDATLAEASKRYGSSIPTSSKQETSSDDVSSHQADELIARYLAKQSQEPAPSRATMAPPSGAPAFGRRR